MGNQEVKSCAIVAQTCLDCMPRSLHVEFADGIAIRRAPRTAGSARLARQLGGHCPPALAAVFNRDVIKRQNGEREYGALAQNSSVNSMPASSSRAITSAQPRTVSASGSLAASTSMQ